MKVLHLLASNQYSGAENVACQIIQMFDGEIEMAYCSPKGDIEKALLDKKIKYYPINKLNRKEVEKIVLEYKPDILHCHDLKASIIGAQFKDLKVISHVHGNKSNMSSLSLKSVLYNWACKNIDKIIWVSNSCYYDYKYKDKVVSKSVILPNIISINDLLNLKHKDNIKYDYDIVYLGRLVYEKNPIRLIEIAKKLKDEVGNFKFAIIGDGIFKDEILKLIENSNLKNNVYCLGFLSNPYKVVADSKLMLMTSVMEGTPMCAIESMALGVPVISTKTDGMVDLIEHGKNGFLYDTDEEAVNFIVNILKNKYANIKNSTINFAEKYNDINSYKETINSCYIQRKIDEKN